MADDGPILMDSVNPLHPQPGEDVEAGSNGAGGGTFQGSGNVEKKTNGSSATLTYLSVVFKPWVGGNPPGEPSETDWDAGKLYLVSTKPADSGAPYVWFNSANQNYEWRTGLLPVKVDGDRKNRMKIMAKWAGPCPPPPPTTIDDPYSNDFQAHLVEKAVDKPTKGAQKRTRPGTLDARATTTTDFLPTRKPGGWLLYKDIPANLTGLGARLMSRPGVPLRASEISIVAEKVDWDINAAGGVQIFGMRRASGSDLVTPGAGWNLKFTDIQKWALVVHQPPSAPWWTNPFVVASHVMSHPDFTLVDSRSDIYVRPNFNDDWYLSISGSYSLLVKPRT